VLPLLPALKVTRDFGLAAYMTAALWLVAVAVIWRRRVMEAAVGMQG